MNDRFNLYLLVIQSLTVTVILFFFHLVDRPLIGREVEPRG